MDGRSDGFEVRTFYKDLGNGIHRQTLQIRRVAEERLQRAGHHITAENLQTLELLKAHLRCIRQRFNHITIKIDERGTKTRKFAQIKITAALDQRQMPKFLTHGTLEQGNQLGYNKFADLKLTQLPRL